MLLKPTGRLMPIQATKLARGPFWEGFDSPATRPASRLALALTGKLTTSYNFESCTAFMTDQLRKKLQEEVDALEHELVHELPKEIKRAAALGDLSENAEYHMAKQRQEFVKARFRQLGKRLADLSLTNMNNIPKDKVGLGSTVKVFDSTKNEEIEYKLVTSEESDVSAGKISTTSPIGRALLNKKVGDEATVITPQWQARTGNSKSDHGS